LTYFYHYSALAPAEATVKLNGLTDVATVLPLLWSDDNMPMLPDFDLVLCSDLIYGDEKSSKNLVSALMKVIAIHEIKVSMCVIKCPT